LLLVLAALVVIGCDSCMKTESHVDVPTKLDEVKKLHSPPDVVVDVKRKKRSAGGGACGHSPLCVIVLPIMAYDALFPKKWDEATVTEKGAVTYVASFETDGDFIESSETKNAKVRHFGRLDLKKLGKHVIVQVGEAPLGPDGKPGKAVKTPILPQVDLIQDYEAALAKEKDGDDRGELVIEATTWLGDEALSFLEKHTKDQSEPDEQRALIVTRLCTARQSKARDLALSGAGNSPGPTTALAGARCITQHQAPVALGGPFAKALVARICKPDAKLNEVVQVLTSMPAGAKSSASADASACPDRDARTLARWAVGDTPKHEDLVALARSTGVLATAFLRLLTPRSDEHRGLLYTALDAKPTDPEPVHVLSRNDSAPSEGEMRTLVKSYLADSSVSQRAHLLRLFTLARAKKTSLAPSVSAMRAALSRTKEQREVLHIALVVLGERQHAEAAARVLNNTARYKDRPSTVSFGTDSLVGYGLHAAGCTDEEVDAAYKRKDSFTDASRGPLCTKAP
jgi:hypothetical protein